MATDKEQLSLMSSLSSSLSQVSSVSSPVSFGQKMFKHPNTVCLTKDWFAQLFYTPPPLPVFVTKDNCSKVTREGSLIAITLTVILVVLTIILTIILTAILVILTVILIILTVILVIGTILILLLFLLCLLFITAATCY